MPVHAIATHAEISDIYVEKSPNGALNEGNGQAQAILTNDPISVYYISPQTSEAMTEYQEDIELAKIARSRMNGKRVRVDLDEL